MKEHLRSLPPERGVDSESLLDAMRVIREDFGHPAYLGRAGDPDEIGRVVASLASRVNTYMTGANLNVDGVPISIELWLRLDAPSVISEGWQDRGHLRVLEPQGLFIGRRGLSERAAGAGSVSVDPRPSRYDRVRDLTSRKRV